MAASSEIATCRSQAPADAHFPQIFVDFSKLSCGACRPGHCGDMNRISRPRRSPGPAVISYDPEAPDTHAPLVTDTQLCGALQYLLTAAIQRQIWLFFFDEQQLLKEPIMPMNDHPGDPYELHETDDMGRTAFPRVFLWRAMQIAEVVGAASFAIVWERPGTAALTGDDMRWLRAFSEHATDSDVDAPLRALLLLHETGLRLVTSDELGD